MARVKSTIPRTNLHISLPTDLVEYLRMRFADSLRGGVQYGAIASHIEQLLRAERELRRKEAQEVLQSLDS